MPPVLPKKALFDLPGDLIYLDGNSLGPVPIGTLERAQRVIEEEWGKQLIRAWNNAGWMAQPKRVGDRIARLIGAPGGSVATGDTLSIKVYQALAAALNLRPDRKIVLSDSGNFPTDLYMAEGLLGTMADDHRLLTPAPEELESHITEEVAVVMLTHVDYRTGRMYDMARITKAAHAAGALVIWDLAHSAGAVPVDLVACHADFAVGCTYKYLNGGPGAPAFIYVKPDLVENIKPALAGWLGHDDPFAMELNYRPAEATERLRVGTPSVLQMAVLEQALDVWDGVSLDDVRAASIALSELFIREVESRCPALTLVSPRDSTRRGSQVSFAFEQGYPAMQALVDHGVIGDFRPPDIMRFGITPLYLDSQDIVRAAEILQEVVNQELWRDPKYQTRSRVT